MYAGRVLDLNQRCINSLDPAIADSRINSRSSLVDIDSSKSGGSKALSILTKNPVSRLLIRHPARTDHRSACPELSAANVVVRFGSPGTISSFNCTMRLSADGSQIEKIEELTPEFQ